MGRKKQRRRRGGEPSTRSPEIGVGSRGHTPQAGRPAKPGRNDPCPCGSGKKYKRCCLPKDQARARQEAAARAAGQDGEGGEAEKEAALLDTLLDGLRDGGRSAGGPAAEAAAALSSLSSGEQETLKNLVLGLRSVSQAVDSLEDRAQGACRRLLHRARDAMGDGALPEEGLHALGDGAPDVVALGRRLSEDLETGAQYLFWYLLLGDAAWPEAFRAWRDRARAQLLPPEDLGLLPSTRQGDRFGVWRVHVDPKTLTTVMEDWTPGGAVSGGAGDPPGEAAYVIPATSSQRPGAEQMPLSVPLVELTTDRWPVPEGEVFQGGTFVGWRAVRQRVPVFFSLVPLNDHELATLVAGLEGELGGEASAVVRERAILEAAVDVLLAG